jgi:hypothetical protein
MAAPISSQDSVFVKGRQMVSILTDGNHESLKDFTTRLFSQIARANASGREVHAAILPQDQFFDAVSRILTGDEICAACALSGEEIFVATNKGVHGDERLTSNLFMKIIEKDRDRKRLVYELTAQTDFKGSTVTKTLFSVCYQMHPLADQASLLSKETQEFEFASVFSSHESVMTKIALPKSLTKEMYKQVSEGKMGILNLPQKEGEVKMTFSLVRCLGSKIYVTVCCSATLDRVVVKPALEPIVYEFSEEEREVVLQQNPEVLFTYSPLDYQFLDKELEFKTTLNRVLRRDDFAHFMAMPVEQLIPVELPLMTCRDPLKRRVAKLFNQLSLIARSTLWERKWKVETCVAGSEELIQFLNGQYQSYFQRKHQSSNGFVAKVLGAHQRNPLRYVARDRLREIAREYYETHKLTGEIANITNNCSNWPNLLTDSLTYELSKRFAENISLDSSPPRGVNELKRFYDLLIQQYQETVRVKKDSAAFINWFACLRREDLREIPEFIHNEFEKFHQIALEHVKQIAFVERYIREDARLGKALSRHIAKNDRFKESDVKVIDGQEGVHAEMRLFSHHLLMKRDPTDYYGIAKLCCALCHYTFNQYHSAGSRIRKRGTHAGLFPWPLPEMLNHNEHMRVFLGKKLFDQYCSLCDKEANGESEKMAKEVILNLAKINSKRSLTRLGLDPALVLQGSSDHYADNEIKDIL